MKKINKFIVAILMLLFTANLFAQEIKTEFSRKHSLSDFKNRLRTSMSAGLELMGTGKENLKSRTTYKVLENGYLNVATESQLFTSNGWLDYQAEYNTYDLDNRLVETITQVFSGLSLVNYDRITQTFYQDGNLESRTEQLWNGSNWENNSKIEYEYQAAGRVSSVKQLISDGAGGFVEYTRELHSYEINPIKELIETQINSAGNWEKLSLTIAEYLDEERTSEVTIYSWLGMDYEPVEKYSYNYSDGLLTEMMNSLWNGLNWVDVAQQIYLYDAQSRMVESFSINYNENSQSWENVYRMINTYYDNDSLMTIAQSGNIYEWENLFKVITTFTNGGKEESIVSFEWDTKDWIPVAKGEYDYDLNGNPKIYNEYFFEDDNWSIYGRAIFTFIPANTTGVDDDLVSIEEFKLFDNYPNPFNPSTFISWQSAVDSRQTLKIYDILGNEVATLVDEFRPAGKHSLEFNASGLASGVYLYKITSISIDGAYSFSTVKKMMLIK